MNIFKDFVESAPVKTPLDFGHNENIVIESIDFDERKRDGITINANTFIKLTKVNPENRTPLASTEINFWNLNHEKDFTDNSFISQFTILSSILDSYALDVDKFDDEVIQIIGDPSEDALKKFFKSEDNCKKAQNALVNAFKSQIEPHVGLQSTLLKCKMISNKSGFLEPAKEAGWILPMSSTDELPIITTREQNIRNKAIKENSKDKKIEPDKTGNAPDTKEKKVSTVNLSAI